MDLKERDFDASVGLVLVDSWWEFGRLLGDLNLPPELPRGETRAKGDVKPRLTPEVRARLKRFIESRLPKIERPDHKRAIRVDRVWDFATKAYVVLKAAYEKTLTKEQVDGLRAGGYDPVDVDGQYLRFSETPTVFWELEWEELFGELQRPTKGIGWLYVVGICGYCGQFFVRSKSTQAFHSDKCRMRAFSRNTYRKKKGRKRRAAIQV